MKDELDTVRAYLDIQKVRMGERLSYTLSIDDELITEKCAPFVIQPLVENAILHGLEPSIEGGVLNITVSSDDTHILVFIQNVGGVVINQVPSSHSSDNFNKKVKGNGIAMENIRQRMALLYGDEASLTLQKEVNQDEKLLTCNVHLKWPLKSEISGLL